MGSPTPRSPAFWGLLLEQSHQGSRGPERISSMRSPTFSSTPTNLVSPGMQRDPAKERLHPDHRGTRLDAISPGRCNQRRRAVWGNTGAPWFSAAEYLQVRSGDCTCSCRRHHPCHALLGPLCERAAWSYPGSSRTSCPSEITRHHCPAVGRMGINRTSRFHRVPHRSRRPVLCGQQRRRAAQPQRCRLDRGRTPAPGSHVGDLVSHGDLLVANGAEITEDAAEGRASTPKIFTSADDGKTWSVAMVGEFVVSVVSTPNGLIAPGWIDLSPIGDQLPRKAAVWTSENGLDWTLAWEAEADVTSSSVATNAIWDDGLVVLGGQGPANYSECPGTSGPAWDRVVWAGPSVTELSANGSTNILGNVEDLKSTSLGHFALTHSVDRSAKDSSAIWRSDDGITWTSANVGVGWYHSSIATDGSTIIIAGDTLGYAPDPEVRIWYTLDGGTWTEYDTSAIPKGLRVKSVELHDGVLVAALYSNDEIGGYLMSTRID